MAQSGRIGVYCVCGGRGRNETTFQLFRHGSYDIFNVSIHAQQISQWDLKYEGVSSALFLTRDAFFLEVVGKGSQGVFFFNECFAVRFARVQPRETMVSTKRKIIDM